MRGAGEHAEVTVTRGAWVMVEIPREAAIRAARAEAAAEVEIDITGLQDRLLLWDGPTTLARRRRADQNRS
eukprot:9917285-Lingulodinium_polyedra.AAC.1